MKRLYVILALSALSTGLYATHNTEKKTKYICSMGGPIRTVTTEFETREGCETGCLTKGTIAYCEETIADDDPVSEEAVIDE